MSQSSFWRYKYLIIILLFAVAVRIVWLKLTLIPDEGELGYDAMRWSRGEIPYNVRLSEKPPLAYLMYMGFTFLGNTVVPVRILNDVLFFISVIAFYSLVKKWYGERISLVASFLYVFFLDAPALWGPFATSIYLSMPFTIFSLLACAKYVETSRIPFLIGSGIFLSIAGLIRLNCFVVFIPLLAILILGKEKRPISPRRFLDSLAADILVLLFSISLPLLVVVMSFWAVGSLDRMIYNVLVRVVVEDIPILIGQNVPSQWLFLGLMEALPLMVFAILGCLACIFVRRRSNIFAISWLLVQVPLFALGPHDFYHLAVIVPAGAILSAFVLCLSFEKLHDLKPAIRFSRIPSYRLYRILLSTILILLFIPSIYFQALQFPSGNTYLDSYSPVGSYDQTVTLAANLKSLNVKNGEVLTQYWLPYVYWLTGINAPSIYLDTYDRGSGIPLEDYEQLFAEVKDKRIPYVIVVSWVAKEADPITDLVRNEYFPLKSIGDVDVYSASYPPGVYFSFITRLQEAQAIGLLPNGTEKRLDEMNDSVVVPRLERLTIDDETEYAIRQHPLIVQSNITYSNIQIPSNATLEFNIALDPAVWTKSDGVLFEITIQSNVQTEKIFSQYVDPKHNEEDRKLQYYTIPLEEYSHRNISISFITNPGPVNDTNWDWSDWGNPLIRQIS
jgi:4-amino-4-deoxy-L-arabinose transferase-like glycosyltransferase